MTSNANLEFAAGARSLGFALALLILLLPAAVPAQEAAPTEPSESTEATEPSMTAEPAEPVDLLFERFSFKLSGRFASLDTTVVVDPKTSPIPGTEIDLESDLGVDDFALLSDFRVDLLLGRRHRLTFLYDSEDRSGSKTIAKEIRFEDIVFLINAEVESSFKSTNIGVGYTYFFLRKERTALGASLGLVVGNYESRLEGVGLSDQDFFDIEVDAKTQFPQPQLGLELRQMIGEKWRLIASAAGIALSLDVDSSGKFDGSLFNGSASIEHMTFKNVSFGFGLSANYLDAVLEDDDERQEIRSTITGGELFIRFRVPTP